jgi:sterol desaturase/sphingolipid hydroxylase (fatty acid hydroxylase superfamily)
MELPFGLSETSLRLGVFAGVLAVLAMLELLWPRRRTSEARSRRWATNLVIAGLGSIAVRALAWLTQQLAVPFVAVAAALLAERQGIGLLNWMTSPAWLEMALALLALDAAIWLQHWASHKVPLLWRLHRVHHADVDFDVTTAVRFHPVEIALSMLYKVALALVLGPSVLAVIVFEVVLNASAMFNHANLALPLPLDRALRAIIVTPDMHRVHHSVLRHEHDTNFGFNLSVWDRLFGTYTPQPEEGHVEMRIGLDAYPAPEPTRLWWSLWLPFGK